jgi:hypothetical protein
MKRELSTTETFEKKKTHVAWFSLILVAFILAYDGSPVKIPGVDVQVPIHPAIFLLTAIVAYSTISFWFESQKILRLNSHFVAGKGVGDTVADVRTKLEEASAYLDRVKAFEFGPVPGAGLGPILGDIGRRTETYLQYLEQLQKSRGGMTETGGVKNHPTEESLHIENVITSVQEYGRRLEEFPFSENDPAVAAAQGRERFEKAIVDFQSELNEAIKAFTDNLTRLSDDILTEGKVQWSFLERWPPLLLGILASVAGAVLLLWPSAVLALRALLI